MEKFSFEKKLVELHGEDVCQALRFKAQVIDTLASLPGGRGHVSVFLAAWTEGGWEHLSPWGHSYTTGAWGLFKAANAFVLGKEEEV